MKSNYNKYTVVDVLPVGALSVKQFADNKACSTAWIYKQFKQGKGGFTIVLFQGINFVVI